MSGPWEKYQGAPAAPADGPWAKYGAAPADAVAAPEQPHSLIDTIASLPGHIKEALTGDKRHTATTDALPDWGGIPELNTFSMASAKAGLGTLLASPEEATKIIKANFPGVQSRQDGKGNFILRSSIDGKEYAMKPGFQASDIPRAVGGIAAFTPAGRATTIGGAALAGAGTQAVIEATQAATGGDFNPGEVAMAGALGGAVPAVVQAARAVAAPAKQLLQRARGISPTVAAEPAAVVDPLATAAADVDAHAGAAQPTAPTVPEAVPAPAAAPEAVSPPVPAPEAASPTPLSAADLTGAARKAADGGIGSKSATKVLAEQAAPDAKTVAAAKRLGVEEYLQPDHVTTNQAYRELAQAVKSIPGSEARAAEMDGLQKVGARANELIDQLGGTEDISTLNRNVKRDLQATHDEIKGQADDLYNQVRSAVPAKADAPADNVLAMINARADELGGIKNLSPMEKMVAAKLSPKTVNQVETVPGNPLMPGAQTASKRTVQALKQPTYALLDDVRRDLTAARIQRAGPFKDSDARLITMMEGALRKDQQAAAEQFGQGATWDLAQKTAASYKAIQDDLSALFGKNLDESFAGDLAGAVRALPTGDPSKFIRLVKSIPESMRHEVVASGLNTAFGKTAANSNGSFARFATWYEGLLKNKQSHAAVMSNLPPEARKQLSDLYRVARGISASTRERITTGRINAIKDELKPADNLAARLYGVAKQSALGATVGSAVGAVAGPGVGAAVASALARGAKPEAIKAVDKLITSPEFIELAKKASAGAAPEQKRATLRLVHSAAWKKFAHLAKQPTNPTAAERWVTQALQNNNQQR
jgi:hypothetical protein